MLKSDLVVKINALSVSGTPKFYSKRSLSHHKIDHLIKNTIEQSNALFKNTNAKSHGGTISYSGKVWRKLIHWEGIFYGWAPLWSSTSQISFCMS